MLPEEIISTETILPELSEVAVTTAGVNVPLVGSPPLIFTLKVVFGA